MHSHKVSYGKVVHSHPYTSSEHQHTESEFSLIEFLSTTANSEPPFNLLSVVAFIVLIAVIAAQFETAIANAEISYASLRGPPVL